MDDEEPRIEIKLRLCEPLETKSNGKKSINAIVANFQCGLPNSITDNRKTDFALFKSRGRDKNQLLLIEDAQNEVLYFDKCIPSHLTSKSEQTKMIGIFDCDRKEVNLLPITYSFEMKSERIHRDDSRVSNHCDHEDDAMSKHQDLVDTFGSKFAVKNMNKQQRLKKTKDATFAAMDRMDTAQLINEKDNGNRKRKRSEMETEIETEIERKYANVFEYEFSESPYCLFEFPFNAEATKISNIYNLKQIVPTYVWKDLDSETIAKEWQKGLKGFKASEFVQRCLNFSKEVEKKKGKKKFKSWINKLVLYDLCVRFVKSIDHRPTCIRNIVWQNLKSALLEQYESAPSRKRIKYSMTRRAKMRIVALVLLLAINVAFWKISVEACKDIAEDLQIPFRVIIELYGVLGCANSDKIVSLRKIRRGKIYRRNPKTSIDGMWW
eukprot:455445_1